MLKVDIVITTYNRIEKVERAIDSALEAVNLWSGQGTVLLVDDASSDNTVAYLKQKYNDEIKARLLVLIEHKINQGVTAAKNSGYKHSSADWVIFLDSDDYIFSNEMLKMYEYLTVHSDVPIVFFRCLDQELHRVGVFFSESQALSLTRYIENTSYGEALTAINKNQVKNIPYDADLRGYEGLGCARIIKYYGNALLAPIYARYYDCSGNDRLSTTLAYLNRSPMLLKGHIRYLKTFYQDMTAKQRSYYIIKILYYLPFSLLQRIRLKLRKLLCAE